MFWHTSLIDVVVAERLAAARATAANERLLRMLRPPRLPLRMVVGARLVALGERLRDGRRAGSPGEIGAGRNAPSRWEAASS